MSLTQEVGDRRQKQGKRSFLKGHRGKSQDDSCERQPRGLQTTGQVSGARANGWPDGFNCIESGSTVQTVIGTKTSKQTEGTKRLLNARNTKVVQETSVITEYCRV